MRLARSPRPLHMDQRVHDKVWACPIGRQYDSELCGLCESCVRETPDVAATAPSDPTAVSTQFDHFAGGHKKEGPPVVLGGHEYLGHLRFLPRAASRIAQDIGRPVDFTSTRLRWAAGLGSSTEVSEGKKWFQENLRNSATRLGTTLTIGPPACWLFRSENKAEIVNLLDKPESNTLPIRLGLPEYTTDAMIPVLEFIGYVARGSIVKNVRNASVLDGSYETVRDLWLPGGTTQPLPWAPDEPREGGGLQETVADAPNFAEIEEDIYIFKSWGLT